MRVLKVGLVLLLWVFALTARAELKFPELTGRVVDNAQLIEPSVREQLTQQLNAHEKATGEQLVVVTLPDLQGTDIADFGYQLGRHWGIGQKDKNNGALLIVARDERRLRIEVGYGLEDRLTDAQSSVIINQVITPAFKTGNFSKGISDGVAAMLVVLGGSPLDEPSTVYDSGGNQESDFVSRHPGVFVFLVLLFILTIFVLQMFGILPAGRGGSGGSSGGFGGGGFGGAAVEAGASVAAVAVLVAAVRRAAGDNNNERALLDMALLTEHEQRKVAEAIARVERDTDAELVTVLAARADDYAYIPLLWASLLALVVPGVVHYLTGWLTMHSLLLVQWLTFIVLCLVFRIPKVTTHLIPRSVRHWRASNLARRQFLEQNLHHTVGSTGMLIFVCEAERYVEILVDEGISKRLDNKNWDAIVAAFTQQVKQGQTLQGFVTCVEACGELLKVHVPVTHVRNELPNRLVVLG